MICYGCGRSGGRTVWVPMHFGQKRGLVKVCVGRASWQPSVSCLGKAFVKARRTDQGDLQGVCAGCGESWRLYGTVGAGEHTVQLPLRGELCPACQDALEYGRKHRGEDRRVIREALQRAGEDARAELVRRAMSGDWREAGRHERYIKNLVKAREAAAYAKGLEEGTNLLKGLALGKVSVEEVSAVVDNGAKKRGSAYAELHRATTYLTSVREQQRPDEYDEDEDEDEDEEDYDDD